AEGAGPGAETAEGGRESSVGLTEFPMPRAGCVGTQAALALHDLAGRRVRRHGPGRPGQEADAALHRVTLVAVTFTLVIAMGVGSAALHEHALASLQCVVLGADDLLLFRHRFFGLRLPGGLRILGRLLGWRGRRRRLWLRFRRGGLRLVPTRL